MKKKYLFAILSLILIVAIFLLINFIGGEPSDNIPTQSASTQIQSTPNRCSLLGENDNYTKPDFNKLKEIMSDQEIVKDVPSNGAISLRFYHFTEDCRIWDKSYILTNGEIKDSTGESDIQIIVDSKYADKISASNFCDVLKEARNNGDFGQDSTESMASLLWKYRSMLKYKDCLGIQI
ncbi:MAG: hypothetical protein WC548_02410 [Candidatus Pacearchaeota archaeon]